MGGASGSIDMAGAGGGGSASGGASGSGGSRGLGADAASSPGIGGSSTSSGESDMTAVGAGRAAPIRVYLMTRRPGALARPAARSA